MQSILPQVDEVASNDEASDDVAFMVVVVAAPVAAAAVLVAPVVLAAEVAAPVVAAAAVVVAAGAAVVATAAELLAELLALSSPSDPQAPAINPSARTAEIIRQLRRLISVSIKEFPSLVNKNKC